MKAIQYKFSFVIILITIIFYSCNNYSQNSYREINRAELSFMYGADENVSNQVFLNIIKTPTADYKELLNEYYVKYIRFPGGIPVRYYIWNSNANSKKALLHYQQYLRDRGIGKEKMFSNNSRWNFPDNSYHNFVVFCKLNNIIPIIQLNSMFYENNGNIYPVARFKGKRTSKLEENRWEIIKNKIQEQVKYTLKLTDNVIWELGNEDYFMYEGETYAEIVIKFTSFLREIDPNAKIIIEMGTGFWGKKRKEIFNKDLIRSLNENNYLNKIDYYAPHFYNTSTNKECDDEDEMYNKLLNNKVDDFTSDILSFFPSEFRPKLFYTEFASVLKSYNNKNFNTQFHAVLNLNYLMRFYANSDVVGVVNMGFTQRTNAMFWDKSYSRITAKYVNPERMDTPLFQYISPQTHAQRLFFSTLRSHFVNSGGNEYYFQVVSDDSAGSTVQILNFSREEQVIPLTEYTSDKRCSYKIYIFKNMNSHDWDLEAISEDQIDELNSIKIPKFSFGVVNIKN